MANKDTIRIIRVNKRGNQSIIPVDNAKLVVTKAFNAPSFTIGISTKDSDEALITIIFSDQHGNSEIWSGNWELLHEIMQLGESEYNSRNAQGQDRLLNMTAFGFDVDDVMDQFGEDHPNLTREQAGSFLEYLLMKADMSVGISWDIIGIHFDNWVELNNIIVDDIKREFNIDNAALDSAENNLTPEQ